MQVTNLIIKNKSYNSYFQSSIQTKETKDKKKKFDFGIAITTTAGTLLPIALIRKYQGKTIQKGALRGITTCAKIKTVLKSFDIDYGLKEILLTSCGSILGGLFGGLLGGLFDRTILGKNENKKPKIKESIFQFCTIAIPTAIVAFLLNLSDKCKNLRGIFSKIASLLIGIGAGMPLSVMLFNKINNNYIDKNKQQKRKLRPKDYFVHIDDIIGALILAKIPLANKLHTDRILPLLYGTCGYEVGTKKD